MDAGFLPEDRVRAVLRMSDLLPLMREALADFSAGRVLQPVRTAVPVPDAGGFLGLMPAAVGDVVGAKLVTFYPRNTALPTHYALIALFERATGRPLATMDGRLITEMRTAAVSAVAADALARPDARILALLGAGVQARSHLEALPLVRPFVEVRAWSRRPEQAAALPGVRPCPTAEAAVRGADVVVTVTSSTEPVLRGDWLSPGAHVCAVGACRPTFRELDETAVKRSRFFVDSRAAAAVESGDVILNRADIAGELGEVLAGRVAGRTSPGEITIFKSLGLAVEDVVTAARVLGRLTC
jgi:ornithine cyclodeaminase/alanine dehydrogenase-like protein (mu-crystallin family)